MGETCRFELVLYEFLTSRSSGSRGIGITTVVRYPQKLHGSKSPWVPARRTDSPLT